MSPIQNMHFLQHKFQMTAIELVAVIKHYHINGLHLFWDNLYIYIRGSLNKFPDFFVWALLLIVPTWNSSPLRSNLLRLQCTSCTVPKTTGRPHGSPLMWAWQWPSSQALSSPQLSHNDSLWAEGITKSHRDQGLDSWTVRNCLDTHLGQIVCDRDGVVNWCIVLVEMLLTLFEDSWPLPTESLPELP